MANVRFVARAEAESYKHIVGIDVANDTFHKKREKHVFYSPYKGGKVRFLGLHCEKCC